MATTTAHLIADFIELDDHIKGQDDELGTLKERKRELERELLDRFVKEGYHTLGARGHTVYVHRQVWAKSAGSPADTVAALKSCGMEFLVEEKFNTQKLSAFVRELGTEQEKVDNKSLTPGDIRELLPTELQAHVDVTEKMSLRVRKG